MVTVADRDQVEIEELKIGDDMFSGLTGNSVRRRKPGTLETGKPSVVPLDRLGLRN